MPRHGLGWLPDLPDARDRYFQAPRRRAVLPARVDLRDDLPAVYDQGALGSCTAQALAGAVEYCQGKQQQERYTPSRLFIYWYERVWLGTILVDSGARLRDGMKVLNFNGAPHENLWAYDVRRYRTIPPASTNRDGRKHNAIEYQRLDNTNLGDVRACLATTGPVIIGVSVYESFMKAGDGSIPLPAASEKQVGGHAILLCGYDDFTQQFRFRNSWGAGWGVEGYGTLPYAYVGNANLADDAWTLALME